MSVTAKERAGWPNVYAGECVVCHTGVWRYEDEGEPGVPVQHQTGCGPPVASGSRPASPARRALSSSPDTSLVPVCNDYKGGRDAR